MAFSFPDVIRIGSRKSKLALTQTQEVCARLVTAYPELGQDKRLEVVQIMTQGDIITDRPLADVGGKGLFIKALEDALLGNAIDMAVHSMKDAETVFPEGLAIPVILPREDCRDVFVSRDGNLLAEMPKGSVIGTSSVRRAAQLRALHPELKVVAIRGNVDTRLGLLKQTKVDGIILAAAGLHRLGLQAVITEYLNPQTFLPAVSQGAVGIECFEEDEVLLAVLATLHDTESATLVTAERAMLHALDGSCRTPIGGHAWLEEEDVLHLRGAVYAPDGSEQHLIAHSAAASDAAMLGQEVGQQLRAQAGHLLRALR